MRFQAPSRPRRFTRSTGVATATDRELFDFVTDPSIGPHNIDACLDKLIASACERAASDIPCASRMGACRITFLARLCRAGAEDEAAEQVFKHSHIPRRLEEVTHFERDAARIAAGGSTEGIYYQTVTGLAEDLSGVRLVPTLLAPEAEGLAPAAPGDEEDDEEDSSSSSSDGSEGEEGSTPGTWAHRPGPLSREELRSARKANKEEVKAAKVRGLAWSPTSAYLLAGGAPAY